MLKCENHVKSAKSVVASGSTDLDGTSESLSKAIDDPSKSDASGRQSEDAKVSDASGPVDITPAAGEQKGNGERVSVSEEDERPLVEEKRDSDSDSESDHESIRDALEPTIDENRKAKNFVDRVFGRMMEATEALRKQINESKDGLKLKIEELKNKYTIYWAMTCNYAAVDNDGIDKINEKIYSPIRLDLKNQVALQQEVNTVINSDAGLRSDPKKLSIAALFTCLDHELKISKLDLQNALASHNESKKTKEINEDIEALKRQLEEKQKLLSTHLAKTKKAAYERADDRKALIDQSPETHEKHCESCSIM